MWMMMKRNPNSNSKTWFVSVLLALMLTGFTTAFADDTWQFQEIGPGTKPALAVTPEGQPYIIYMLERFQGWAKIATIEGDSWQVNTLASGYFYGPPDIAIGDDGIPHASFHDHQYQDAVYATLTADGAWTVSQAGDAGHDGWDNRVTVDAPGRPHMVAVDPEGSGIEYYRLDDDGSWQVEQIGSGPLTYKYATAVAVHPDGTPHISYYDQRELSLRLATRSADGWSIETVDNEGDTGLFSHIMIDAAGGVHLSYLERTSATSGNVKYAYRSTPGEAWQFSTLASLDKLFFGFTGARNITSISLDSQGRPWVAFSDEAALQIAVKNDDAWALQTVVEAAGNPLGQIVSLKLDASDTPHLAYSVITDKNQLDGTVWYGTTN
jgi:hypothetical protein